MSSDMQIVILFYYFSYLSVLTVGDFCSCRVRMLMIRN
jgi:hypothetical protein